MTAPSRVAKAMLHETGVHVQARGMLEPELPGIPPPPSPSWWKRPHRLITKPKLPGWVFLLWVLVQQIPDWKGRIDFWLDAAKDAGGYAAGIAVVIGSPYFSLGLAGLGVLWLAFAGEPQRGVQRHPALPYLGWSLAGLCFTAIVLIVGWGAVQAYIQEAIVQGVQTQQVEDRRLSHSQVDGLLRVFKPIAGSYPNNIQVEAVSASPDAAGYAQQFMFVFHMAGLTVNGIAPTDNKIASLFPSSAQVSSSQMRGLFIGVQGGINISAIPERALKFQAALREAGFVAQITGWNGVGADDFVFVVSYR